MQAEDISFVMITENAPSQYEARDSQGRVVGFVRSKFGTCAASCPDAGGEDVYFSWVGGYWGFENEAEKNMHLDVIRHAIAEWYAYHPGVYEKLCE